MSALQFVSSRRQGQVCWTLRNFVVAVLVNRIARPHPGPLPRGEGIQYHALDELQKCRKNLPCYSGRRSNDALPFENFTKRSSQCGDPALKNLVLWQRNFETSFGLRAEAAGARTFLSASPVTTTRGGQECPRSTHHHPRRTRMSALQFVRGRRFQVWFRRCLHESWRPQHRERHPLLWFWRPQLRDGVPKFAFRVPNIRDGGPKFGFAVANMGLGVRNIRNGVPKFGLAVPKLRSGVPNFAFGVSEQGFPVSNQGNGVAQCGFDGGKLGGAATRCDGGANKVENRACKRFDCA